MGEPMHREPSTTRVAPGWARTTAVVVALLVAAALAVAPATAAPSTAAPAPAEPGAADPPPVSAWPVEPPEAHHMDPAVLEQARAYAFAPGRNTQGVVVVRHGKIVSEWYADGADQSSWATSWSVSKSFTSAMIGIAIGEGLIPGVDEPMTTWFPEWVGTDREHTTLRDVLTMTSGLDWNETYSPDSYATSDIIKLVVTQPDQLAYVADRPQAVPPGTRFNYSSGDSMLLSRVIEQATGMPANEYARQRIFEPMGIDRAEAWVDAAGHGLTYCCIDTTSRGFARFGQVFLQDGRWGDRQVVPADWVAASTAPSPVNATYGFQWWLTPIPGVPDDVYAARGHDGQYIYVVPSLDLVVVRNGSYVKYDGPPVADPNLFNKMPSDGLIPGLGTLPPSSWRESSFLGPIVASIADPPPPPYEEFDGPVDQFYVVPSPLPPGEPGDLIRVQAVSSTASTATVRIMYHSRDALGRDRAVTGMLTYPTGSPPDGGWPVVSHANGTVGLASRCALSRGGRPVSAVGVPAVAVATDYIGLGPVGERHPYLSRLSEGHSVIDAVRAARNLPGTGAGSRWLAIGGSQGGHGALSASELSETYAPELELLGTVAFAPAAMFDRVYGGIDPYVTRVVGAMGLYGQATEYPEIDPHDYVSAAGIAVEGVFDTGCLDEITAAVLSVPFDEYYDHDPRVTEPARSIMLANDVGNVAVDAPVFLVQGTADTTVVPERTRDLLARLCATGQVTEYLEVDGAGHGDIGARTVTETTAWLQARLDGEPAATSCAAAPAPEPTTTTTAATPTTTTDPAPASAPPTTTIGVADLAAGTDPDPVGATGLPRTGADGAVPLAVALAAIALGAALVVSTRRSRAAREDA